MNYPRHVYRLPGSRKKRGLPEHERAVVVDAEAHAKAKAAGWSDSYDEAIAAHAAKKAPAKQSAPAKPEAKQPDLAPVGEKA